MATFSELGGEGWTKKFVSARTPIFFPVGFLPKMDHEPAQKVNRAALHFLGQFLAIFGCYTFWDPDPWVAVQCAIAKLQEFKDRGYPRSIRTYVCAVLARDTGNTTWFRVRDVQ